MEEKDYQEKISEFETEYDTEEKVDDGKKYVDEKLWEKVQRVGKKITFTKDIFALYKYLLDDNVSWHRKSIVAGALIYFIAPIDSIPDIAPLIGYLDDLGVIAALLKYLGSELVPYYEND